MTVFLPLFVIQSCLLILVTASSGTSIYFGVKSIDDDYTKAFFSVKYRDIGRRQELLDRVFGRILIEQINGLKDSVEAKLNTNKKAKNKKLKLKQEESEICWLEKAQLALDNFKLLEIESQRKKTIDRATQGKLVWIGMVFERVGGNETNGETDYEDEQNFEFRDCEGGELEDIKSADEGIETILLEKEKIRQHYERVKSMLGYAGKGAPSTLRELLSSEKLDQESNLAFNLRSEHIGQIKEWVLMKSMVAEDMEEPEKHEEEQEKRDNMEQKNIQIKETKPTKRKKGSDKGGKQSLKGANEVKKIEKKIGIKIGRESNCGIKEAKARIRSLLNGETFEKLSKAHPIIMAIDISESKYLAALYIKMFSLPQNNVYIFEGNAFEEELSQIYLLEQIWELFVAGHERGNANLRSRLENVWTKISIFLPDSATIWEAKEGFTLELNNALKSLCRILGKPLHDYKALIMEHDKEMAKKYLFEVESNQPEVRRTLWPTHGAMLIKLWNDAAKGGEGQGEFRQLLAQKQGVRGRLVLFFYSVDLIFFCFEQLLEPLRIDLTEMDNLFVQNYRNALDSGTANGWHRTRARLWVDILVQYKKAEEFFRELERRPGGYSHNWDTYKITYTYFLDRLTDTKGYTHLVRKWEVTSSNSLFAIRFLRPKDDPKFWDLFVLLNETLKKSNASKHFSHPEVQKRALQQLHTANIVRLVERERLEREGLDLQEGEEGEEDTTSFTHFLIHRLDPKGDERLLKMMGNWPEEELGRRMAKEESTMFDADVEYLVAEYMALLDSDLTNWHDNDLLSKLRLKAAIFYYKHILIGQMLDYAEGNEGNEGRRLAEENDGVAKLRSELGNIELEEGMDEEDRGNVTIIGGNGPQTGELLLLLRKLQVFLRQKIIYNKSLMKKNEQKWMKKLEEFGIDEELIAKLPDNISSNFDYKLEFDFASDQAEYVRQTLLIPANIHQICVKKLLEYSKKFCNYFAMNGNLRNVKQRLGIMIWDQQQVRQLERDFPSVLNPTLATRNHLTQLYKSHLTGKRTNRIGHWREIDLFAALWFYQSGYWNFRNAIGGQFAVEIEEISDEFEEMMEKEANSGETRRLCLLYMFLTNRLAHNARMAANEEWAEKVEQTIEPAEFEKAPLNMAICESEKSDVVDKFMVKLLTSPRIWQIHAACVTWLAAQLLTLFSNAANELTYNSRSSKLIELLGEDEYSLLQIYFPSELKFDQLYPNKQIRLYREILLEKFGSVDGLASELRLALPLLIEQLKQLEQLVDELNKGKGVEEGEEEEQFIGSEMVVVEEQIVLGGGPNKTTKELEDKIAHAVKGKIQRVIDAVYEDKVFRPESVCILLSTHNYLAWVVRSKRGDCAAESNRRPIFVKLTAEEIAKWWPRGCDSDLEKQQAFEEQRKLLGKVHFENLDAMFAGGHLSFLLVEDRAEKTPVEYYPGIQHRIRRLAGEEKGRQLIGKYNVKYAPKAFSNPSFIHILLFYKRAISESLPEQRLLHIIALDSFIFLKWADTCAAQWARFKTIWSSKFRESFVEEYDRIVDTTPVELRTMGAQLVDAKSRRTKVWQFIKQKMEKKQMESTRKLDAKMRSLMDLGNVKRIKTNDKFDEFFFDKHVNLLEQIFSEFPQTKTELNVEMQKRGKVEHLIVDADLALKLTELIQSEQKQYFEPIIRARMAEIARRGKISLREIASKLLPMNMEEDDSLGIEEEEEEEEERDSRTENDGNGASSSSLGESTNSSGQQTMGGGDSGQMGNRQPTETATAERGAERENAGQKGKRRTAGAHLKLQQNSRHQIPFKTTASRFGPSVYGRDVSSSSATNDELLLSSPSKATGGQSSSAAEQTSPDEAAAPLEGDNNQEEGRKNGQKQQKKTKGHFTKSQPPMQSNSALDQKLYKQKEDVEQNALFSGDEALAKNYMEFVLGSESSGGSGRVNGLLLLQLEIGAFANEIWHRIGAFEQLIVEKRLLNMIGEREAEKWLRAVNKKWRHLKTRLEKRKGELREADEELREVLFGLLMKLVNLEIEKKAGGMNERIDQQKQKREDEEVEIGQTEEMDDRPNEKGKEEKEQIVRQIHWSKLANAICLLKIEGNWPALMEEHERQQQRQETTKAFASLFRITEEQAKRVKEHHLPVHLIGHGRMLEQMELDKKLIGKYPFSMHYQQIDSRKHFLQKPNDEPISKELINFLEKEGYLKEQDGQIANSISKLINVISKWNKRGRLLVNGSYALNAHSRGSDIDCIVLVPEPTVLITEGRRGMENDEEIKAREMERQFFGCSSVECDLSSRRGEDCADEQSLFCMLCKHPDVSFIRKLPFLRVPLIQFSIDAVDFDLAFVSVPEEILQNLTANISGDNLSVKEMDELIGLFVANVDQNGLKGELRERKMAMFRSLAGYRSTLRLRELVDGLVNAQNNNFRLTVLALKHWAKKHSIYGGQFGFFNGISLTLLACKIFLQFPGASLVYLLEQFFILMLTWEWPKRIQLEESPVEFISELLFSKFGIEMNRAHLVGLDWNAEDETIVRQWNFNANKRQRSTGNWANDPKEVDRLENHAKLAWPILTPSFPTQNTGFNINHSTKQIMLKEIREALDKIWEIKEHQRAVESLPAQRGENDVQNKWREWMEPKVAFRKKFDRFFLIMCITPDGKTNLAFCDFVGTRIRKQMIYKLESIDGVKYCHASKFMEKNRECPRNLMGIIGRFAKVYYLNPFCTFWLIGIETGDQQLYSIDYRTINAFDMTFYPAYINANKGMAPNADSSVVSTFFIDQQTLDEWFPV